MANFDEMLGEMVQKIVNVEIATLGQKVATKAEKKIVAKILEEFANIKRVEYVINGDKKTPKDGLRHSMFDEILKYMSCNISAILVGPAGSGKTHIAVQCAELLERVHYSISVNEQTSKTDFLGYMDANGQMVKTNFRRAYEEGGVFIVDEIDCANPNILTIINSALSNGFCPFPDGMVARHSDFLCICTANTFGEGESAKYIGRNILDAATRDRFATIVVDYDPMIERALNEKNVFDLGIELRDFFSKNKLDVIISTRGMLRLSALTRIEGYKITIDDVKSCLNLKNVSVNLDSIIQKHV
jgi:cobaltochelatase CobS